MAPFLDELPADVMAVAERLVVLPAYRGAGLFEQIVEHNRPFVESHGLRVVIGCCEPHLLSLYLGKGQRTYADRNINSPEAGYLIPLVNVIPDVDALRGVGHNTERAVVPVGMPSRRTRGRLPERWHAWMFDDLDAPWKKLLGMAAMMWAWLFALGVVRPVGSRIPTASTSGATGMAASGATMWRTRALRSKIPTPA